MCALIDRRADGGIALKVYGRRTRADSTVGRVPVLENMGFRVRRRAHLSRSRRDGDGGPHVWFHDMLLERADSGSADLGERRRTAGGAVPGSLRGDAENDGFNALVLGAGLDWRDVALLARAFALTCARSRIAFRQDVHVDDAAQASGHCGGNSAGAVPCALRSAACMPRRTSARSAEAEALIRAASNARWQAVREPRRGPHPAPLRQRGDGRAAHELLPARAGRPAKRGHIAIKFDSRQARAACRCRVRSARSSSTRRASRACTCASARSRAAACAGPTGARISAPKCWAS